MKFIKRVFKDTEFVDPLNTEAASLYGNLETKKIISYNKYVKPGYDGLCFTAVEDSTVKLTLVGTPSTYTTYELYTSTDGENWDPYTIDNTISISAGNKLYWKGNNATMAESFSIYKQFVMTGKIAASGNCNSLLGTDTLKDFCYIYLFNKCTSLTTAPELPAITLKNYCYYEMFYGCTSLITAPELPATILTPSCYSLMFYNCTSLTTAPKLPATTLANYCYSEMFFGCTSLTTAPELPATILTPYCYYYMFTLCTSLTTAPKLPATTLGSWCYAHMFKGCASLTTAPELPATTLVSWCYYFMFSNCTRLSGSIKISASSDNIELEPIMVGGMLYNANNLEKIYTNESAAKFFSNMTSYYLNDHKSYPMYNDAGEYLGNTAPVSYGYTATLGTV